MELTVKFTICKLSDLSIDKSEPLFIDFETDGLYGKIVLAQFMQEGWEAAKIVKNPEPLHLSCLISDVDLWAHNVHYEISTLADQLGFKWQPKRFNCALLAARLAFPTNERFTLDAVMHTCLGYDPYDKQGLDKKALQKSDWSATYLSKSQYSYAATDVFYMPEVYHKVKHVTCTPVYQLDIKTLQACFKIQHNGLKVDQDKVKSKRDELTGILANNPVPINVNSWQQVRKWIGCTQSADDALAILELKTKGARGLLTHDDLDGAAEKAALVRKVRKVRKQLSFVDKYDKDRLYGKFKPLAISGRMTSDSENLQQIPRALKCLFGGNILIFADYAQLELRTICAILGVSKMEDMYRKGIDTHTYTANMLNIERLFAKGANFGLLYGAGAATFIGHMRRTAGAVIDERTSNTIKRKWLNLYTEINKWQQQGASKWRKGRLGYTPLGRPYKAKLMTDFLNIENQGAGAEVAKLAFHYLLNEHDGKPAKLDELRDKHRLSESELFASNFIHDSYIIEYAGDREEVYIDACHVLGETMQEAWFQMSKLFKIKDLPMPVDVRAGYNWKDVDSDDGFKLYQTVIEPYKMLEK